MDHPQEVRGRARLIAALLGLACTTFPAVLSAQEAEPVDSIRRATPSGEYIDPASFFRFHGYVTLNFSEAGSQLGSEVGATPQILVSGLSSRTGRNESGFKNDAALFVGGEPFDGVGTVMEIHFVGNAMDPVLTEAKITWDVVDRDDASLQIAAGRFWWPFGIHNGEWFSSVNRFAAISPAAAEAVPAHYNEVGFMADGAAWLGEGVGLNYVVSVGNGVPSFELMPNVMGTSIDTNGNRTLTARAGLVFGGDVRVELGFSGAGGDLRAGEDASLASDDPHRYAADFVAWGPDVQVHAGGWELSGYYYRSSEDLVGAPLSSLDREGLTVETAYLIPVDGERFRGVSLQARGSFADEDRLDGTVFRRVQWAFGGTLHLTRSLRGKIGYVVQREGLDAPDISNNLFSISLTAEF